MQHLIILIILLLIAGLTFTVTRWKGGLHMTFSQHAATNRSSKSYYATIFFVTLPLLMLFFTNWLVPTKNLHSSFLWFAVISIVFQLFCTWIPEEGGRKTIVHRILTTISATALLPLIIIIATSANLSMLVRNTAWVGLFIMIAVLGIALSKQKEFRYALLLQTGYYTVFFIVLMMATYL